MSYYDRTGATCVVSVLEDTGYAEVAEKFLVHVGMDVVIRPLAGQGNVVVLLLRHGIQLSPPLLGDENETVSLPMIHKSQGIPPLLGGIDAVRDAVDHH